MRVRKRAAGRATRRKLLSRAEQMMLHNAAEPRRLRQQHPPTIPPLEDAVGTELNFCGAQRKARDAVRPLKRDRGKPKPPRHQLVSWLEAVRCLHIQFTPYLSREALGARSSVHVHGVR